MRNLITYIDKLGFNTAGLSPDLSLALGTLAMSPLKVATGYAILANGGYRVEPYLIARVEDMEGAVLFQAEPLTVCTQCDESEVDSADGAELSMEEILSGAQPQTTNPAPRVMDERVNYILNSIMRDVITRGTGRKALVLERKDIAGKTGTTNGPMDAWFSGYNHDIVTTTWVGFDNYTPLGRKEFGGTAALPIWIDYMREALKSSTDEPQPLPAGLVNVRIDPDTGLLAAPGQSNAIFEYFREEHVPQGGQTGNGAMPGGIGTDDLIEDIF